MKISLNEIRSFNQRYQTTGDIAPNGINELVEKIGSQLGAVEEVIDVGKKYENIAIVKVVSCQKHSDADKLNICKIDDGGKAQNVQRDEQHLVQVICGAPNVRAGMLAVWIPPGKVVPSTADNQPVVLDSRQIRGQTSHGMLASSKELALSDDHAEILEIDHQIPIANSQLPKPGDDFARLYGLDDYIIDIENKMFTHRPDCFGTLGVAREIAGILGHEFCDPDWYWKLPTFESGSGLKLEVFNQAKDQTARFMAVAIKDVTVQPSPIWLQVALSKLGQKPINNIVDLTNFYMLLTAQPTHAYDYDKLRGHKLEARLAKKGESLTLLNRKTYHLGQDDLVIADDSGPIGLAGVMGGAETEVDAGTKNIVLECANFDMYTTRRMSMKYGLFSDAVTRFSKGQSPLQIDRILAKLIEEIIQTTGGVQASQVFDLHDHQPSDIYDQQSLTGEQRVGISFINQRLGLNLTGDQIETLLRNVHFACYAVENDKNMLNITAPFWRTDIAIGEDIVEEIGRLYGYDRLPLLLPQRDMTPVGPDELLLFKQKIRSNLASMGANELLTYSFVHGDLLEKVGQNKDQSFKIGNAISPDLQYYRQSLTPSLLDKVHGNIKAGYDRFALFEINKTHLKNQLDENGLPREFERLALVFADQKPDQKSSAAFFQAKNYLLCILKPVGLGIGVSFSKSQPSTDLADSYYRPDRSATVKIGEIIIGRIGQYQPSVVRALKLPEHCAGFELDLKSLLVLVKPKTNYQPASKYPSISQDICLQVDQDITYGEISKKLSRALNENLSDEKTVSFQPIDIFSSDELGGDKRVTFRVSLTSYHKTLLSSDASNLLDQAVAHISKNMTVTRI